MKRTPFIFLTIAILSIFALVPVAAQDATTECVTDYDATVDYFPEKATFDYAEGVEVEYFNNYKVVRTLEPYPGATEPVTYVLVQCGTPRPRNRRFPSGHTVY